MSLQLIIVMETDKKCQSDWMYIDTTIKDVYKLDSDVKLSPVYMGGKGNYRKKEKDVKETMKKYEKSVKGSESIVIYCFDCDNYDSKREDRDFLYEVEKFCSENGYEFVWFCKDIERVYIGEKVENGKKRKKAVEFVGKYRKNPELIDLRKLSKKNDQYIQNSSNLLTVLDKYLSRKS